jgi:hypothetical protein
MCWNANREAGAPPRTIGGAWLRVKRLGDGDWLGEGRGGGADDVVGGFVDEEDDDAGVLAVPVVFEVDCDWLDRVAGAFDGLGFV